VSLDAPIREHLRDFTTIPTVDLSAWRRSESERAALAEHVREICHHVGFFYLVGHRVDASFTDEYFSALQRFFALPEDTKAQIDKAKSPHFRGWERTGAELTNNRPDHREQLDLSTENPPYEAGVQPAYLRLDGPNQWLPEEDLPGFRAIVGEFFRRMSSLAWELMAVLSRGLGLADGHLESIFGERPLSLVKLISYPPTPPGAQGVGGHHDAGFLTILLQRGVPGLQALNPLGDWIDIPPVPGAFVVNLGEMLQEMTGNYFVATTHRVIAQQARFSSAYFHGPDLRTPLEPLPLAASFAEAVAASERHAGARFMAKRHELLEGRDGISSTGKGVYGQQVWNYYVRSYPENMRRHHPDVEV
jgi:isopenicillin N synthase-like dioxygenase